MSPWIWKRLHCMGDMQRDDGEAIDQRMLDAGYCLDRYTIESPLDGTVMRSTP